MRKKSQIRKRHINQAEIVHGFAERLRALRRSRRMSQAKLAQAAQIHVTYVAKLERGGAAVGIDLLARLASALGVTPQNLLPDAASDPLPFLQKQAREGLESVLLRADSSMVEVLNAVIGLMEDALARGRKGSGKK